MLITFPSTTTRLTHYKIIKLIKNHLFIYYIKNAFDINTANFSITAMLKKRLVELFRIEGYKKICTKHWLKTKA